MLTAPGADELEVNPIVQQALDQAWLDSLPTDPDRRHEEGGWIYMDVISGTIHIERAPRGTLRRIDLSNPPHRMMQVVVAKFHTHPNPSAEGWELGSSDQDKKWDDVHGVPDLIKSDKRIFHSGPKSRRGGLGGPPGFPN